MKNPILALVASLAISGLAAPTNGNFTIASQSPSLHIKVVNKHNKPVNFIPRGAAPKLVAPGLSHTFPAGTGPSHAMFVDDDKNYSTGEQSIIEWTVDDENHFVYDVSMVDAFTLPVVCGCKLHGESSKVTYVNGCNLDLWALNDCPDEDDRGDACANPMRHVKGLDIEPAPFFKPCQHAAMVYPDDGVGLDVRRECTDATTITCCVGTKCEKSLRQLANHDDSDEDNVVAKPHRKGHGHHEDPEDSEPPHKSKAPKKGEIWCTRDEPICESLPHCDPRSCDDDGYCGSTDVECKANWDRKKQDYAS